MCIRDSLEGGEGSELVHQINLVAGKLQLPGKLISQNGYDAAGWLGLAFLKKRTENSNAAFSVSGQIQQIKLAGLTAHPGGVLRQKILYLGAVGEVAAFVHNGKRAACQKCKILHLIVVENDIAQMLFIFAPGKNFGVGVF